MAGALRRFSHASGGAAAVEFAMVLPFLVFLYVGASELSLAVTANRKIDNTSATISDLVTQAGDEGLTVSELNFIMALSKASMEPFDAGKATIRVTQVFIDAQGVSRVDWSSDASTYPRNRLFPLPAGIANQRERHVIVTETSFRYEPVMSFGIIDPIEMKRVAYHQPRTVAQVRCTDCPVG
ncbi:TadE/TadG family type IV pilus assembly protein [Aureimonas populi]|uniref:TadE/TadG family type IV pilus assembly protein n=1 Tax=Aureimonas populi TaxID=1701758 RepID=A0ABW5CMG4_9HYPH|nr:TadE/TadG family type IV pilus assembly protein [Aureimonas populi]